MTNQKSVLMTMADREGLEVKNYEKILRQTVFPANGSDAELAVCLVVARDLNLSPLRREIFFFKRKDGGIQPIIAADGWYAIAAKHPEMRGFELNPIEKDGEIVAIECTIYRHGWQPCKHMEWMVECRRPTPAWQSHPKRMLGHRAFGQTARKVFGFAGIMDQDEYEAWQESPHDRIRRATEARDISPVPPPPPPETPPPAKSKVVEALTKSLEEIDQERAAEVEVLDGDDVPLYASDPDQYLLNLEESCALADTSTVLSEIYDCHVSIEENMFPPDRAKADAIFARHEERIAHAEGGKPPRARK